MFFFFLPLWWLAKGLKEPRVHCWKEPWFSWVLFDMWKLWHLWYIQGSICRTHWHAMWSAASPWRDSLTHRSLAVSFLQHSKVTVLHPSSHTSSQDPSLPASVTWSIMGTKTHSAACVVEDKGGNVQVPFRNEWAWTLPCYCHVQFYVRLRTHTHMA